MKINKKHSTNTGQLIPLKSLMIQNQEQKNENQFFVKKKKFVLKSIGLNKTQIRIQNQKINLGTHPLSLDQNFSKLVQQPEKLLETLFKLPPKIKQPAPLIFNKFSYTKSCPLNLQYNSLSVSSRIAINYTPLSKYLYLDFDKKKIKILHNKENKALFLRQIEENDDKENLQNLSKKRYYQYLENILEDKDVINFLEENISKIITFKNENFKYMKIDQINILQNELIDEIKKDFKFASKKALLDYILKDKEEKIRLGIEQIPNPCKEYGEDKYRFQMKNYGESFIQKKQNLEQQMILFNETTIKIVNCWIPFENQNCFTLDELKRKHLSLDDFCNKQYDQQTLVKNEITTNWIKKITDIYKGYQINSTKEEMKRYFRCIRGLIQQQARELLVKSIYSYVDFLKQFKKEKYKTVEECLLSSQNILDSLEKSFLIIKIKEENDKIIFEKPIPQIKQELINLLSVCVSSWQNIACPDNQFIKSDVIVLQILKMEDEIVQNSLKEISDILDENFKYLEQIQIIFKDFLYLFKEEENLQKIIDVENVNKKTLMDQFNKYKEVEKDIVYKIPHQIHMSLAIIDCRTLKNRFKEITQKLRDRIMDKVNEEIFKLNNQIGKNIKNSMSSINGQCDNVQKLIQAEENLDFYQKKKFFEITNDFDIIVDWFTEFYIQGAQITNDILKEIYSTKNKILTTEEEIQKERTRIKQDRQRLENLNKEDNETIQSLQKSFEEQIKYYKTIKKRFEIETQLPDLKKLIIKYEGGEKKVQIINEEEKLLGLSKSEFQSFKQSGKTLQLFDDLWSMVDLWEKNKKTWENKNIFDLDVDSIHNDIQTKIKSLNKIIQDFNSMEPSPQGPLHIAEELQKSIRNYKEDITLLKALCQTGIKERHWDQINNLLIENQINLTLNANTPMFIKMLKESGIKNCLQDLQRISEIAAKEYSNEKSLDQIEEEWEQKKIELQPYKIPNSAILTLQEVEDMQALLEDHLIKVQTMKGSQYAKVYKPRIEMLEQKLNQMEKTFDCWLKVQTLWIFLEPIFSSEDIMKSLPEEGSKFKRINEEFLAFIQLRIENPEIIELAEEISFYTNLSEMRTTLEHIDKNLENYLDRKRSQFPRFYFLSSDSLIDILSQSKEPKKIQKYIKILFEGIQTLQFNDNEEIEGMISSEGEIINFEQKIVPKFYKGLVERWLTYLEETMIYEVKKFIIHSLNDYAIINKDQFVLNRPGQALVNVLMTVWTFETENTIKESGLEGLKEYYKDQVSLIGILISLFEKDITKIDRCGLETCIVISVHNRDIIEQLVNNNVETINNFTYESQMRYYWGSMDKNQIVDANEATVKIMNTVHQYNYEYLGNSPRLVITPLTDRCYRTLCSAVYLFYGGAPEGPAGTGKTETVKDLAKALARMIVVFNCSDKMDYKSMERFLKGLVCSGGWSCFDEFNRIELEVLSVIAQQLQKIQNALAENKSEFLFEGSLLKIKPTCNCFITMNPGYAGRSELPDNLKALFRSVAMMVPDYVLIAEIRLFSFGFKKAKQLAMKIVTTYKLCSEQISPQKHYDYGMRAVNSTLSAAGNFKKKNPEEDEEIQILKAIQQVNEAKFLSDDLPLFYSITKDLFPSIELQKDPNVQFLEQLQVQSDLMNLKFTEYFSNKIQQLYETLKVRHGVMLVGKSFGGKTSSLNVLQNTVNNITKNVLNPKALVSDHLYGYCDPVSQEWTDGVLTVLFKNLSLNENIKGDKWLVFDGPVDAVWIENLNTVLDDNKKLCLSNGDVFYLSNNMNMIFEVEDLAEASPATVSRCGMVYYEPHKLGWLTMIESWKNKLPNTFNEFDIEKIDGLIKTIMTPLINFIFSGEIELLQEIIPQQIIQNTLDMASNLLHVFEDKEIYQKLNYKERFPMVDQVLIYSLGYAIGNVIKENQRKLFDQKLRKLINTCDKTVPDEYRDLHRKIRIPDSGNILDYKFSLIEKKKDNEKTVFEKWMKWSSFLSLKDEFEDDIQLKDLFIETQDTIKYREYIQYSLNKNQNILVCGGSGTGKTQLLSKILKKLNNEENIYCKFCFSGQTNVHHLQQSIEGKLIKRKGKHNYGPSIGKKMIIFIDDLNMPKKEIYGAQPSIELLRQLIEQKGFYNLQDKSKYFMNVQDVKILGSMTIHNSSNKLSQRFLRHMNIIPFIEFDKDQLFKIFNTMLNWHFTSFNDQIGQKINKMTHFLLDTYQLIRTNFLPLPTKIHYMFNLRDIYKVIKGVCLSKKELYQNPEQVYKLFVHEIWRVFGDKLISFSDRTDLLNRIIKPTFNKVLQKNFDIVFQSLDCDQNNQISTLQEMRGLIFTNLQNRENYQEIEEKQKIINLLNKCLNLYNTDSDKPLNIVLFSYAIEHLLIIYRILQQESSHGLLLGLGGSGRTSLTKLASFILNQEFFQLQIGEFYTQEDWQEDLKKILKNSGQKKEVVFYFSENQIKEDYYIEDINNLLNNGEIPNLFNHEDKGQITEIIGQLENQDLFEVFNERVKQYLHVIISFSEIGQSFKKIVKMFPSIVNCCSVDWFSEWPDDALTSVGNYYLQNTPINKQIKIDSIEILKNIHYQVKQKSSEFRALQGRINYVTGNAYLELLTQYDKLYERKNKEIIGKMNTYLNGYDMILESEKIVADMQEKLKALLPELEQANQDTEKVMIEVKQKKEKADEMQEILSKEEEKVRIKANKAKEISDECQFEIDKIQPELDRAIQVVKNIKRQDFDDLKSMNSAPLPIKYSLQCLCYILDSKPIMVKDPKTFRQVPDWWATSKKMIRDLDVKKLIEFDNEKQMDEIKFKKLNTMFESTDSKEYLNETAIKYSSEAAAGMFLWVLGQKNLYLVNKSLKPRKIALQEANEELAKVNAILAEKQILLDNENKKVQTLNDQLQIIIKRKLGLEKEYNTCLIQTERAHKLIDNLADEKDRWKELAEILKEEVYDIVGSIIISAGFIAYLGPFTSQFRNDMQNSWIEMVKEKQLMREETQFSFNKYIGVPIQIRKWTMKGLPSDSFSITNTIIMENSQNYSLFIDPQFQANKFLKNFYKNQQLQIVTPDRKDLLKILENSVQYGLPIIVESIEETLSSSFDTILLKQTFKQGSGLAIKIGDKIIEYNQDFQFFMTTKISNPHYSPDITTKTKILNFMITQQGLRDQLLSILVVKEKPVLEEQREKVMIENFNNKNQLNDLENQILQILSLDKKKLLEDETAITVLTKSKKTSKEIMIKQKIAEETEKNIEQVRENYIETSSKIAKLFFSVNDLSKIDRMYEYSLEYFLKLVEDSIDESEKNENIKIRIDNIFSYFHFNLYKKISRSIFVKDKLIFSFLMLKRLQELNPKSDITSKIFKFYLTGVVSAPQNDIPKPKVEWLTQKQWLEILYLSEIDIHFQTLPHHLTENLLEWKELAEMNNPLNFEIPYEFKTGITNFQKIVLYKCFKPDKVTFVLYNYVKQLLGEKFVSPPSLDLNQIYLQETNSRTPIIFLLTPGVDPYANLKKLEKIYDVQMDNISLGQGQGPIAKKLIKKAYENGNWVVLQNCHLAVKFMKELEKECEIISNKQTDVHDKFRIWLTTYPSINFPLSILQNSLKITNEPPKGLKNNISNSLNIDLFRDPSYFDVPNKPHLFKLVYSLCFFHSLISERKNYGSLGWNIPYEFTESDLTISGKQLQVFINNYPDQIPLEALNYIIAQCNYGGRVTDEKDRILIKTLIEQFFNVKMLYNDNYQINPIIDEYKIPSFTNYQQLIELCQSLPVESTPEIIGFHQNARITKEINESQQFINTLIKTQEGKSQNDSESSNLLNLIENLSKQIPKPFDISYIQQQYPIKKEESMNTVLQQDTEKFNRLLLIISESLKDISFALQGFQIFTNDLEEILNSIQNGKVPNLWLKYSYPSLKHLSAYIQNLTQRIEYFQTWIQNGKPKDYWISGFFFTQGFLTSAMQNYSRTYSIPIDKVSFNVEVVNQDFILDEENVDHIYVYGMFLEGASFDYEENTLVESQPRVLYLENFRLKLSPYNIQEQIQNEIEDYIYKCPLYRTIERRGELLTTGHSTNFVTDMQLPTDVDAQKWIMRGVALLLELNY